MCTWMCAFLSGIYLRAACINVHVGQQPFPEYKQSQWFKIGRDWILQNQKSDARLRNYSGLLAANSTQVCLRIVPLWFTCS